MRRAIPQNHVTHDYEKVLEEFISLLKSMLGDALVMVYLTGSYARVLLSGCWILSQVKTKG